MTAWSLPHRMPRIFFSAIAVSRTVRFAVRRRGCNERITRADLVSVLRPALPPNVSLSASFVSFLAGTRLEQRQRASLLFLKYNFLEKKLTLSLSRFF